MKNTFVLVPCLSFGQSFERVVILWIGEADGVLHRLRW